MIQQAIQTAIQKQNLSFTMTKEVMDEIMSGRATNAQIASFLTALRMKGETPEEITACAMAMREKGARLRHNFPVAEIVGTGGDEAYTFNISTVSCFVIAACGMPVAKHGNRSVSSKCGAADLLEALGAQLMLSPLENETVLKERGLCFMFAQVYHASMKYAAPVRKELGTRTIFNVLGPLANPAAADINLIGVYDKSLVRPIAQVLFNLGVRRGMVVHGLDGLDEISMSDKTAVCEIDGDTLKSYTLDPRTFGFSFCSRTQLTGGGAVENAEIAKRVLSGEKGPKSDIIALNAAVVLYLADKCKSIADGITLAKKALTDGSAYKKMQDFIRATNRVRGLNVREKL